ncbi:hypothetical protein [Archaeoglobus veneficus]|uniref:Major facilitator superfamily (MFS) profile domain-containing protein n=1 Tax=Archaeoglobus veneficus (strain DSM 11195 / SNP6) TaxID=693661 RepID=F2KN06_ARCVS|nr:hypothetical protein [Archaeoglobus veneficus]AEA47282.1 hypothetical protein Arcve_1276 [Archaeoglobus veneficus SNP6]
MSEKKIALVSVSLLCFHGLIEIIVPILFILFKINIGILETGEGVSGIEAVAICIVGAVWGITRFVAGWGIWRIRKWAIILGILMSVITITASTDIIPAGMVDTVLSAPVLVLLLYLWFEDGACR